MVPVYKKMHFLDFLLNKNIITNDIACTFFKELSKNPSLLQKVHFSKYALVHMKYCIVINTAKKYCLCSINGKTYKSYRLTKYILRALKENKDMQIAVCIVSSRAPFEKQYEKVCSNDDLVKDLVSSAAVDLVLNGVQKDGLKDLIDKCLDEGNRELFMQLTAIYKELSI